MAHPLMDGWMDYCSYIMYVSRKEGMTGVMCLSFKNTKKKIKCKG